MPAQMFLNSSVEEIKIGYSPLGAVPDNWLYGAAGLLRLILKHCLLPELPPGLLQHSPALQLVDLSANDLEHLPQDFFRNLHSLVSVNLAENKLHQTNFFHASSQPRLRQIRLAHNSVSSIDQNLLTMSALQQLDLR